MTQMQGTEQDVPQPPLQAAPPEKDARTWGTICHLAALAAFIGIPFGNILGPLVIWLIKRNDYPFVDQQGKSALNFQISVTIYAILPFILVFVIIGIPLLIAIGVADLILVILAAVKAGDGQTFKYPLTIKFIK
jgi:hypothetical protein